MNNGQIRDLCIGLLRAETEDEVIGLLKMAGYWDRPAAWRHYGDVENNWGQGGNRQSLAEAALAEKIVNSVDARLVNECLERNIDPKGADAPQNIREAVARFFEGGTGKHGWTGFIDDWSDAKIREVAQGITLCGTGTKPILNLTISDSGEGQVPQKSQRPSCRSARATRCTFRLCKASSIRAVLERCGFAGKTTFNSSSAGAIRSSSGRIRMRAIRTGASPWCAASFRKAGGAIRFIHTSLPSASAMPIPNARARILSFSAPSLKIFPDKDEPYGREASFGTAIKLYDYKYLGERSNIIRGRSILSRLDLLLPEIALPIRLYEFRKSEGGKYLDPGSRETTLSGLRRRLNNTPNVEAGFPIKLPFAPSGEQLYATVYAFKPAGTARDDEEAEERLIPRKRSLVASPATGSGRERFLFATARRKVRCPRIFFGATL